MKKFQFTISRGPVGELHTNPIVHRFEGNPILTAADVPFPCELAMNAGVSIFDGKYVMAFRFDSIPGRERFAYSGTGLAWSKDGIKWDVEKERCHFHYQGYDLDWVNDARLTVIDGKLYLSFCFNTLHGERPGIAVWKGGTDFEVICLGIPAQRNLILCPEKINGKYWRLERPVTRRPVYDIWISFSEDLVHWGEAELLLGMEDVPFATMKIGGSAPPVKTDRGWLMTFHAVDNDPAREVVYTRPWECHWISRYTMGAALLDLNDPQKVIAMTRKPLLVPEMDYETGDTEKFFRENVVFPCGALPDGDSLRLYYGAGDYSTCMARIRWTDLWDALTPYERVCDKDVYSRLNVLE